VLWVMDLCDQGEEYTEQDNGAQMILNRWWNAPRMLIMEPSPLEREF